jgi:hypothetical protein
MTTRALVHDEVGLCRCGPLILCEYSLCRQAAVTRRVALAEVEERRRRAQREAKTTAVSLAMAVTGRGWQLGRPQFSVGSASKYARRAR